MFTEYFLEKVLADEEARKCPIGTQSTMIHVIEKTLEEIGIENRDLIMEREDM